MENSARAVEDIAALEQSDILQKLEAEQTLLEAALEAMRLLRVNAVWKSAFDNPDTYLMALSRLSVGCGRKASEIVMQQRRMKLIPDMPDHERGLVIGPNTSIRRTGD